MVWSADWSPAEHARAVESARTYIAAGDTYQCNLTDRLRATVEDDLENRYAELGSVTGAPKTRTMEIIRELETGSRGVYCGAIGVLAPPDAAFRARFSVAIRTVVADRRTGRAVYGVGGGITWDSDPAAEHAELAAKAAVLTVPQATAGSTTGRAG